MDGGGGWVGGSMDVGLFIMTVRGSGGPKYNGVRSWSGNENNAPLGWDNGAGFGNGPMLLAGIMGRKFPWF